MNLKNSLPLNQETGKVIQLATQNNMIHPHTYIHPNAKLATNVKVDPFSVIHQNVEIGEGTWIGSNVTIMEGARIGKNCRIFPGAVIAAIPQDLKYEGEQTTVEIGDNTTIREFVTINRGSKDRWTTKVGNNCLIMAYSHVAHDCIVGNNCIMSNNTQMAGHVVLGDYAILGGMCAIHQFVQIGQHAFVSGGSLVSKDVPPYIKAGRTPLSYAGVNSVGLKRRGFSLDRINQILDIYRVIYNKSLNTSQALNFIEEELQATDERDEIVTFIRESGRGIIKRFTKGSTEDE
ncbi:MAG TPA: acyl-ACP--UDP-N-acetylglucosamine O-acyltransferase [Ferruginibacter sp.]|jgi:UDP-N-acetylglucosamine acyltransferase|nr:acyl-ACP--UDP-N-acetylglucosamine O-acyltransferase [Ferruginibacter sp.]